MMGDDSWAAYLKAFSILEDCSIVGNADSKWNDEWTIRLIRFPEAKSAKEIVTPEWEETLRFLRDDPDAFMSFLDLGRQIEKGRKTQRDIFKMADGRWDEHHPEQTWRDRHPDEPASNYDPEAAEGD
jgi:hypothetical protein